MADQYNYSFDVNAFLETVKEDIAATPEPTGVMAPSKAKAKEVPEVSPFEKLKTDFAKAVQGSYADPEELRRIYSERRKADPVPTREMTLADWDAAAKRSADEVAQAREMAGITRSRTTDYAGNPPADPNWINRQAIVRDDMGGVAIKQPEPVSIIGEQPPKVRPVGREDMLEGAGLASPMGGPNRGSVRPAEEEEATTGEGLMSRGPAKRAKAKSTNIQPSVFTEEFVELMAESEGTTDHTASEGQFTYAYGILPATAKSLGVDPDDYSTRKEFATAVYGKMYSGAKESYPEVFKGLDKESTKGVLSLYINLGGLPSSVEDALSGEEKDISAAADSLKNVVHFTVRKGTDKGTKYASKGLSKRRAEEFNILMRGQESFKPVTTVAVEGTKDKPVFVWQDEDGQEVKRFASSRKLSPDNSMKSIGL